MKLSKFAVKHPAIVGIMLIALTLFGVFSISTQNMEFMGDISLPQLFVITVYPGASAEDIEQSVINVMEDDFVTLPDYKSMTSSASASVGSVVITFRDGVDPYGKIDEVRNRVDALMSELPDGIDTPTVIVGGASMLPIMSFSIEGDDDIAALSRYVNEDLRSRLTQIAGVSSVEISGLVEPRIDIKLNLESLDSKGISPVTCYQILSYSNVKLPLGSAFYNESNISIDFDGALRSIEEIRSLPVGSSEDGGIIRLGDVSEISLSYAESDYRLTHDGNDIILVDISKRPDGNTVEITNRVKEILKESEAETDGAIEYNIISDDSALVVNSMKTVILSGLLGVLIAVVIIFAFLNDRKATLAIGLSIPLSIFFTFIGMKLAGITINLLSISGIVVSLGSIVDASIVIIDQVYRQYKNGENGRTLSVTESILKGTDTVGASVLGSNLTTVIVFVPFLTISGIIGSILYDVSMTFMISILASLVVALIFMPWLLKKFLKEGDDRTTGKESIIVRLTSRLERSFSRSLDYMLKHPMFILLLAIGLLAVTIYTIPLLQVSFLPSTDNNDFYVSIDFPNGYSFHEAEKGMLRAEEILKETINNDDIKTYVTYIGKSVDAMSFSDKANVGGFHIVLVPVSERDYDIHFAIRELQYALEKELPGASIRVNNGGYDRLVGFISGGGGYGLKLIGNDEEELYEAALGIEEYIKSDPEVISTSIDANYDNTNATIKMMTDQLSSLGFTSYESGMNMAILFNGMDLGAITDEAGNRYSLHLSSDIKELEVNDSSLSMIKLVSQSGSKVALPSLSELEVKSTLSQINHSDRARTITISALLTTESPTGVTERVERYLKENPLPSGVRTDAGGIGELVSDSLVPIASALMIAIFLVYMVMVVIFERFRQPLLVMLTVPFCLIGVIVSLVLFGSTLNLVSILGIVSLAGMLVNNGIIMVDYINYLRDSERRECASALALDTDLMTDSELVGCLDYEYEKEMLFRTTKEGAASRLRPILMSSLTTILGVIPMAMATGEGTEIYAPLGQVIMGGLATSMVITLFIMPVFYYMSEKRSLSRIYRKREKRK